MNEALTKGVFAEKAKGDLSPEQIVVSNLNGTGLWGSFPGSQGADKTQLAGFTSHHPSRAESSCPDTADEGLAHDEFVSDEPCVSLWAEIRDAFADIVCRCIGGVLVGMVLIVNGADWLYDRIPSWAWVVFGFAVMAVVVTAAVFIYLAGGGR